MVVDRSGAVRCANCGVEIPWRPAVHHGRSYCCGGCAQGGPCYCSYDLTTVDRRGLYDDANAPIRASTPAEHALWAKPGRGRDTSNGDTIGGTR